jgi:YD repeat-containing protein
LTQITDKNIVGYTYAGFTYTLDAVGNRTKVVEANGRTVDYQYDNLNRLISEQITNTVSGNRNFGYTYDLAGNRLTKTDSVEGTTAYAYDANNRLTQTAIGTTVNALTYDLNGSLLKVTDGTKTTLYTWANDGENRLLSVNDGTNLSRYVYNGMGDRVASIDNGVRTNYLTAGSLPQVVLEYDVNGVTIADYTLGLDLIRRRADGREGYYHTDGLGSTRVITDNVGLVLNRYDYDAFGVTVNETAAFVQASDGYICPAGRAIGRSVCRWSEDLDNRRASLLDTRQRLG